MNTDIFRQVWRYLNDETKTKIALSQVYPRLAQNQVSDELKNEGKSFASVYLQNTLEYHSLRDCVNMDEFCLCEICGEFYPKFDTTHCASCRHIYCCHCTSRKLTEYSLDSFYNYPHGVVPIVYFCQDCIDLQMESKWISMSDLRQKKTNSINKKNLEQKRKRDKEKKTQDMIDTFVHQNVWEKACRTFLPVILILLIPMALDIYQDL